MPAAFKKRFYAKSGVNYARNWCPLLHGSG